MDTTWAGALTSKYWSSQVLFLSLVSAFPSWETKLSSCGQESTRKTTGQRLIDTSWKTHTRRLIDRCKCATSSASDKSANRLFHFKQLLFAKTTHLKCTSDQLDAIWPAFICLINDALERCVFVLFVKELINMGDYFQCWLYRCAYFWKHCEKMKMRRQQGLTVVGSRYWLLAALALKRQKMARWALVVSQCATPPCTWRDLVSCFKLNYQ